MKLAVPKETTVGERRVALVPESVKRLVAKGFSALVESGAGALAGFNDEDYRAAGAETVPLTTAMSQAELVLKVVRPSSAEFAAFRPGMILCCLQYPLADPEFVRSLVDRQLSAIALDLIPRSTLAQSMDVLSSQANFAGYWAVIAAAARLPKIFPLMMTPAGTITPARVLIMGTGVAGLSAIGTAKRLGAVVEATDVRPETKEQAESLGAKFLQVTGVEFRAGTGGYAAEQSEAYRAKQAELIAAAVARADVVITTALIPGRPAPRLLSKTHVESMHPGSVIVDLAAEQGGNVEGAKPGEEVQIGGVTLVGAKSPASQVAFHASQAFSRNVEKLLLHLSKDNKEGAIPLDSQDEIARGCIVTDKGQVVHAKLKDVMEARKSQ